MYANDDDDDQLMMIILLYWELNPACTGNCSYNVPTEHFLLLSHRDRHATSKRGIASYCIYSDILIIK